MISIRYARHMSATHPDIPHVQLGRRVARSGAERRTALTEGVELDSVRPRSQGGGPRPGDSIEARVVGGEQDTTVGAVNGDAHGALAGAGVNGSQTGRQIDPNNPIRRDSEAPRVEIGRASCRERAGMSGMAG